MVSAGESATFFVYLERTSARQIDAGSDVLARLYSEQMAKREVGCDHGALWILRNSDANRQDLHDRFKLRHSFLELRVEIANLLFGCDLSGYIGVGTKPSHQIALRVADRYGASKKPAIFPFFP